DGTDVAATFLDALDCELTGLDGRSMLPAARGEGKGREFVVTQYDDFCFSITTPTHKLIRYDSDPGDVGELYDLEQDPLERHNRWTDPALAGTRDALLAQLAHWRRDMETEARNQ
ncbi:MAG: sulfatase/phosphatase domain-containing protein, partial [Kiritimatiellia bacterium]